MSYAQRQQNDAPFHVVLGAARSGTTLLRLLLDAHPEIGCPGETGIPFLLNNFLQRIWPAIASSEWSTGETGEVPEGVIGDLRRMASIPIDRYLRQTGKNIYCDKSLDSGHYLKAVKLAYPDAKYILAFRHVMDCVASGLRASPFGFDGYGYAPFIQASPTNTVEALVTYWCSHVQLSLEWERAHPDACLRVIYENLVTTPEDVLDQIWSHLGVEPDNSVTRRAFRDADLREGGMDYKIAFTSRIHADSVGAGRRIPVSLISAPLLEAVNHKLGALGYQPLDRSWNAVGRDRHDRPDADALLVQQVMDAGTSAPPDDGPRSSLRWALVLEDYEALRWTYDPSSGRLRRGDGDVEFILMGAAADFAAVLRSEENVGQLIRDGRLRHLSGATVLAPAVIRRNIQTIVGMIRAWGETLDMACNGQTSDTTHVLAGELSQGLGQ
jgi:hypothetical protein